jgi:hypothetical protein
VPGRSPQGECSHLDKVLSMQRHTVAAEGPSENGAHLVDRLVMKEGTRVSIARRRSGRSEMFVLAPGEDLAALVAKAENRKPEHTDFDAHVDLSPAYCVLHDKAVVGCSDMEIELSAGAPATRSYASRVVCAKSPGLVTPCEALQNTLSWMRKARCRDLQKVLLDRNQQHQQLPVMPAMPAPRVSDNGIDLEVACQARAPSCPKVL